MTTIVRRRTLFAFLGPAVAALLLVGIAPLLYAVWKSLHLLICFEVVRTGHTIF